MILRNAKVDFQLTGWVSEKPSKEYCRFGRLGASFIEKVEPAAKKNLKYIVDSLYSPSENRVAFLLDYYQPKYERVVSEGLKTVSAEGFSTHEDKDGSFVGFTKDSGESWLYLVRGQEVLTDKGHFIAGGLPIGKSLQKEPTYPGPRLIYKLHEAKDLGALIIASHPMTDFGIVEKTILRLLKDPSGVNMGIQERDLAENAAYFDALESYSLSMSPEQTMRVKAFASEFIIPTVTDTDSTIENAFSSYNRFFEINFTDRIDMIKSFQDSLKNTYINHPEKIRRSLKEKINHVLLNVVQDRKHF